MRARSLNLALVLCVVLLTATPVPSTTIGRERPAMTNGAMFQNGLTRWSPFGPWMHNMVINIYQDPLVMLTALQAGQIDITDWPILRTSDLASIWSYSDYFATSAAPEFGLTDLEINSHPAMMGIPLNTPRSTGLASFVTSASVTACATGVGSLTISLVNQ